VKQITRVMLVMALAGAALVALAGPAVAAFTH
jgi:hypothetical protein